MRSKLSDASNTYRNWLVISAALLFCLVIPSGTALAQVDRPGDFVVTWEDDQDGNDVYQIFARGFRTNGAEEIDDFTVNSTGDGQQLRPAIAIDAAGNFVVVWEDDQDGNGVYQIYARGFNADGSQRFADIVVNTVATGQQRNPAIAMTPDGRFVVTWLDYTSSEDIRIAARGFNASGTERFGQITVNSVGFNSLLPDQFIPNVLIHDMDIATNGDFVVVWVDDQDENGVYQIRGRGFDVNGAARINTFTVNSTADGQQFSPAIAMASNGEFVVTWEDDQDGNEVFQILARGFNANGSQRIPDFTVNSEGDGQQINPTIAMDSDGDFIVTWEDDQDGNDVYQIYARGFHPNGNQSIPDFTVNSTADGQQRAPVIAMVPGYRTYLPQVSK